MHIFGNTLPGVAAFFVQTADSVTKDKLVIALKGKSCYN